MTQRQLVFTAEREVELNDIRLEDPGPEEVVIDTRVSAISPGSELLVYRGQAPEKFAADTSITSLNGDLSFPTSYGYAAVGDVTATGSDISEEWLGRRVFAFHPHQSSFRTTVEDVYRLPDSIDSDVAALIPTVETATNAVLDGGPRLGERVVVFGAGVVGLCTIRLLSDFPLERLVAVEPIEKRRELARKFGADTVLHPDDVSALFANGEPSGADLAFEFSGQPAVLDRAIDVVGYDGRVMVGSWYGSKQSQLDLGRDFHRDRISIKSTQVSTLSPTLRGRWTTDRRLETAIDRLGEIDTESIITHRIPFTEAASAYHRLDTRPESTIQVLLTYDD